MRYDTTTTSGSVVPATAPRKMPSGVGRPGGIPVHAGRWQGGSLAQVNSSSGEIYRVLEHASIREEWKELHIIGDEDETGEQDTTLDDPEDIEEDTPEEEGVNYNTEEEEEIPEHRRDENNEYYSKVTLISNEWKEKYEFARARCAAAREQARARACKCALPDKDAQVPLSILTL